MPDVGLTTAGEPVPPQSNMVIRYTLEIDGMPVYQESYDVAKLTQELANDRDGVRDLWFRRITCPVECRNKETFSAELTSCLAGNP